MRQIKKKEIKSLGPFFFGFVIENKEGFDWSTFYGEVTIHFWMPLNGLGMTGCMNNFGNLHFGEIGTVVLD